MNAKATTYISNRPSYSMLRGTVATMHRAGSDNQPACGKRLKNVYRLSGRMATIKYSLCPACRKLEEVRPA